MRRRTPRGWLLFGTCDKTGETDLPLTYYPRTRENLISQAVKLRDRELVAKKQRKEYDAAVDRFQELTSGNGS